MNQKIGVKLSNGKSFVGEIVKLDDFFEANKLVYLIAINNHNKFVHIKMKPLIPLKYSDIYRMYAAINDGCDNALFILVKDNLDYLDAEIFGQWYSSDISVYLYIPSTEQQKEEIKFEIPKNKEILNIEFINNTIIATVKRK